MKTKLPKIFSHHVILITILVYVIMTVGSMIPINFKALNPFKKGLSDYDATDLVFCEFKEKNSVFDNRIVLVNVGVPDRREITELIGKIESYGPRILGLDIHFEDFNKNAIDTLLRKAFKAHDNIILAKRLSQFDEDQGAYFGLEGCHDFFCDSLSVAYTNFYGSTGMTIRKYSPYELVNGKTVYGLGTEVANRYMGNTNYLQQRDRVESINYIGDKDAFINIDKEQILNGTSDLSETFKDKLVMMGYLGTSEWEDSVKDKFVTPMNPKVATKTNPDMYGLTIHANIAHMNLEGTFIERLSPGLTRFINLLLIFMMVAIFNKVYTRVNPGYWKVIKVIQLLIFALLFLIVSFVLYFFDLKLELGVGILGAVLSWDAVKWYNNLYIKKQSFFKPKSS